MEKVMIATTVPVDDIVGVVASALPVKEQGDDSSRQITRPIIGGDINDIGPLAKLEDIEKLKKPVANRTENQAAIPTEKPKKEVKVEEVSTNLEIVKAAVEVSVSVADEKDSIPLLDLKKTIETVEKTVSDAIDAKVKEDVAKVEVEVAESNKQKKQDELKVILKKAADEKSDNSLELLQDVKKEFDDAKKAVSEATTSLKQETAKKESLEAKVEKEVEVLEKKKISIEKTAVPEVKKMMEDIAIKAVDPAEKKKSVDKPAMMKSSMLPTAIDEMSPEVIVKTDCDFLKQAELVSEFFFDKKDKKCYGMASATVNGTKQLFAVQCATNMVGACPTELSMDTCKVSSLTTQKLADLF